ncbi:aminodeoxychorismate synthase component I [uncultured Maricaulis sp.]|uniref:aminodeoxychorismate synthase component I n=1 Tax=uncultured Maricaulis sp. TaxID=174710 RepID=UPI0030D6DD50|tara:strand:+ start:231539 stop:232843 length:1305 start_codon:yes stop_codon:yes gene_type:complete
MSPLPQARPLLEIVRPWRDPIVAFAPLAGEDRALLLHDGRSGRARIFAWPSQVFDDGSRSGFEALQAAFRTPEAEGMLAGLFGYDLASVFEALPTRPARWPALAFARYPVWAEFDQAAGKLTVRGRDPDLMTRLADLLERAPVPANPMAPAGPARWSGRWSPTRYLAAASRARDYVHAGDVFQVNLSQAFEAELAQGDEPYAVFERLCRASPAPHAAYFRLDATHVILTNSPERFVSVRAGQVEARPIKGTRKRSVDPVEDAALASELAASAKDRAENLMIVDLMRNDISRVCASGSVRVPVLCAVESYANVHHLVSVVEGELAAGQDVFDLVTASFPPGSITGAPKVRAMQIIAELEGESRGPYCGALGWISEAGDMDLNVMIRTAAMRVEDGVWHATIRSGGGIVADSDPQAEYEETLTKASALRRAVEGAQ